MPGIWPMAPMSVVDLRDIAQPSEAVRPTGGARRGFGLTRGPERIAADCRGVPSDMMRPVLLVGASGRVGRMVLHHWSRTPDALRLVPQYRGIPAPPGLNWDPLQSSDSLMRASDSVGGFGAMIVLAGVTPGSGRPLSLNSDLAEACLRAAGRAGIGRVLMASSSAVYGAGSGVALCERAPCAPVNAYGAAKLAMERACTPWREVGLEVCALRIGNVAGADALMCNIAGAEAGTEASAVVGIDIFADGTGPQRSYIGPRSLARVLYSLCRHPAPLPPVLNVAAPSPVRMSALAEAAGHPWRPRPAPPKALHRITLDCRALAALHAFAPEESRPDEMVRQWQAVRP